MRTRMLAVAVLLGATVGTAGAQAQAPDTLEPLDAVDVETTALLIPVGEASTADISLVNIGLRRGIRSVEGVSFVHPVDRLEQGHSDEVYMWVDQLDAIADMVRTGDARDAYQRADEAIDVFENNLRFVRRSALVDAYMLAAVGRCAAGRARECRTGFRRIIAFRENHEFDVERYGPEHEPVFEREKLAALSGARGTLFVETEPEGAEVYIDGRSYGPSPVTAVGLLAGSHYITVKELGYDKLAVRADVRGARETAERYVLEEALEARRVLNLQGPIMDELGQARSGERIRQLGDSLGTGQTIVGTVTPNEEGQLHVQLYLYHVHTRLLQNQVEATVSPDEVGMDTVREIAIALYEGVDLGGGIDAPEDDTNIPGRQPELYEQWWFWVTVIGGAAVVAGAIGAGVALSDGEQVPGGFLRIQGTLP
ncbi:MAG: PEGA domain-containing protein [Sandaracinaceae bacterium]